MQETQETWVRFPGWEDPLEEETATHSSILSWEFPWTEEPGGLQSIGLQRVGHDWTCMHAHQVANTAPETFKCLWLPSVYCFSVAQSCPTLVTPRPAAHQASLSVTNSQSPPKPMSIESVMPSGHLILCCPLLLLPSIFPSIRVFSNQLALHIRWPKYWSFSISPSNEYSGLMSFTIDWIDLLLSKRLSGVSIS